MAEQLPPEFMPFGHVVGRVIRAVGDTAADLDADPEAIPVTGTGLVRFTPLELTRVVAGTVPSTWVQQETIAADLDSEGFLALSGARGLLLWPGAWKVSAGSASAFSFPAFTIQVTAAHTAASPLDLWTAAPYSPPAGAAVTTLVVPAGAATGQVLGWDGSQLVWQDAGSGGDTGTGSQGPQGVGVASITDTDGDGVATVTLHDPKTNTDTTSALPLPRGTKGDDGHSPVVAWSGTKLTVDGVPGPDLKGTDGTTPATPAFTATATTLEAGSAATASIGGTYPNLAIALGIPRGADGSGGSGGTGETDTGWVDLSSQLDPAQLTGSLAIRRTGITVHLVGRLSALGGVTVEQRNITVDTKFRPKHWSYSFRTLGAVMYGDRGGGTADSDAKIISQGTPEDSSLGIIKLNFSGDVDITWTAGDAWPTS